MEGGSGRPQRVESSRVERFDVSDHLRASPSLTEVDFTVGEHRVQIAWPEAVSFTNWASEMTGGVLAMPATYQTDLIAGAAA